MSFFWSAIMFILCVFPCFTLICDTEQPKILWVQMQMQLAFKAVVYDPYYEFRHAIKQYKNSK